MTLAMERRRIRLHRRSPYAEEHRVSVTVTSDWRRRQPTDLRDAVRLCRRAYADEIPTRLSEGSRTVGDDGNPRFAPEASSYILGPAQATDAGRGEQPFVSYYRAPFRATLERMRQGDDKSRLMAAIVWDVSLGAGPFDAAIRAGVTPASIAKDVAELALRAFLRSLSDIRVDGSLAALDG